MLTSGNIEFEPPQTKVFPLTRNVVAMISGDGSKMLTICQQAWADLQAKPQADVAGVVGIVTARFAALRRSEAEASMLTPLGLDLPKLLLGQKRGMDKELVASLLREVREYSFDSNLIITGTDGSGAHIYIVGDPGRAMCCDLMGFAAIGVGDWHAESQFMVAKYVSSWPFEKALRLLYLAKKRAETAPGVGTDTDLFIIGSPPAGAHTQVGVDVVQRLHEMYEAHMKTIETMGWLADTQMEDYVKQLEASTQEAQETATESGGKEPPEPGTIRGDPEKGESEDDGKDNP